MSAGRISYYTYLSMYTYTYVYLYIYIYIYVHRERERERRRERERESERDRERDRQSVSVTYDEAFILLPGDVGSRHSFNFSATNVLEGQVCLGQSGSGLSLAGFRAWG